MSVPSLKIGTPHALSCNKRVCLPTEPTERGGGDSQFGRLERKLSTMSTL